MNGDFIIYFKRLIPDKLFLELKYKQVFKKKLNLKHPQTFNEKLQWLKLYDHNPIYSAMVDKYEAKKYVAKIIGSEYIIPTFGVWDSFDQIDFGLLPNQFVLKCTHDSGGLVVVRDKSRLNIKKAKNKLEISLKNNYYWSTREWPYKAVKPRIIAEKYMEDASSIELKDYKFYCFNGHIKFLYLSQGLENHKTARISYVTLDWKQAPFYRDDYKAFEDLPKKPVNFNKMIILAEKLSRNIPFLRVDFYEINGKIYFGETTFYPGAGFTRFEPDIWDAKIGEFIKLPKKRR